MLTPDPVLALSFGPATFGELHLTSGRISRTRHLRVQKVSPISFIAKSTLKPSTGGTDVRCRVNLNRAQVLIDPVTVQVS